LAIESDKALNQYSKGALGFSGNHGARQEMKNMYFGDERICSSVNIEVGMVDTDGGRNSSTEPGNVRMYLENVKRKIDKAGKERLCCMNKENSVHEAKNCTLNLEYTQHRVLGHSTNDP